eukprot:1157491-Pelagomonas_calceolata.AAC.14
MSDASTPCLSQVAAAGPTPVHEKAPSDAFFSQCVFQVEKQSIRVLNLWLANSHGWRHGLPLAQSSAPEGAPRGLIRGLLVLIPCRHCGLPRAQ